MGKKKAKIDKKYTIVYLMGITGQAVNCVHCNSYELKMIDLTSDTTKETASFPVLIAVDCNDCKQTTISFPCVVEIINNFEEGK